MLPLLLLSLFLVKGTSRSTHPSVQEYVGVIATAIARTAITAITAIAKGAATTAAAVIAAATTTITASAAATATAITAGNKNTTSKACVRMCRKGIITEEIQLCSCIANVVVAVVVVVVIVLLCC